MKTFKEIVKASVAEDATLVAAIHTVEEVRAVFGDTIQPGLDLVKAEPFCVDYETTLVNNGQVQTRMRITGLVCKETAIEFRVNGVPRTLPTELAVLDKISLLVVSPPTSLRRVTVKLRGVELMVGSS